MDRKYLMVSFGYGIVGLLLGIYMAASKNHGQFITHAHIMLVGFVISFIYAACYKIWITDQNSIIPKIQYYLHLAGSAVLLISLFLMFGQFMSETILGPILGVAAISVLASMVMMKVLIVKSVKNARVG
jgi:hypothetical protein